MQKQRLILGLIALLIVAAIVGITQFPTKLGLDLQGGSQLTIQVKTTPEAPSITDKDLESVQKIVENRINGLGVSESLVQTSGSDKVLVQLPGVSDPQEAEKVLGGTAVLEFREQKPNTEIPLAIARQKRGEIVVRQEVARASKDVAALKTIKAELSASNTDVLKSFGEVKITGKQLKDAFAEPVQNSQGWNVALRFDPTGAEKFAQLTKNLAGTKLGIGIFVDNYLISSPTVPDEFKQTGISGGAAIIQGNFTAKDANSLAVQLKGGSLPFPVEIVENRTVSATLGRDSIQSSIYAGVGGLLLVLVFMGIYYRLPGMVANVSLIIYALLNLAAFNVLGVTLTLAGIAGFILSIGMAVDANILIFERTREELRAGKTLYRAVESGFYRAFSSVLDGNVTTLIACAALFGLGTGLVKGFALTLGIGVAISMFTALTCTRTILLFLVLGIPSLRQKPQLFCPNLSVSNNETPQAG
jgi:preprotein translocase subunit SecD